MFLLLLERKFPKFFKTHTTFVSHSLLIPCVVCQHYSIFWSYPVLTDIFKSKVEIFNPIILALPGPNCKLPVENFLIFSKHLLLLIQERL